MWEIGDGFKPSWEDYYDKDIANWKNYLRKELLFADYFSFQDAFVWDLSGAIAGTIIGFIIRIFI